MKPPVALTIAGCDPSGGAGLAADLKTFHQHGVFGTSVVTLLTVQNTRSVSSVKTLGVPFVLSQLDAVLDDIPPAAIKTGALGSAEVIAAVAGRAKHFSFPLVVDPVMISKHGQSLIDDGAVDALIRQLLPTAFLITPNVPEAERLAGMSIGDLSAAKRAAAIIADLGARHVLIKGNRQSDPAVDMLFSDRQFYEFSSPRIDTLNTHGTGCVFSAAITARLALGDELRSAVEKSKRFIAEAIRTNPGLGGGFGPVNMHVIPD